MAGAGLALAPFTFGWSLGLTVAGAALGVGGAATTVTATIIKDSHLKDIEVKANDIAKEMKKKDDIVHQLMEKLKADITELR